MVTECPDAVLFEVLEGEGDSSLDELCLCAGVTSTQKKPAKTTGSTTSKIIKKPAAESSIIKKSPTDEDVRYTDLTQCTRCKNAPLLCLKFRSTTASVWDGAKWVSRKIGTKRCYFCMTYYKLNYMSEKSSRKNTIQSADDDSIVLVNEYLGFTFGYLRQLWHRVCRASVSFDAEVATILLTYQDAKVGNMRRSQSSNKHKDPTRLAKSLSQAVFIYLRLAHGQTDFDIRDPMPSDHPRWGSPNTGVFTIFNASRDDPTFVAKKMYNIVTDGNQPLRRSLAKDENTTKRLPSIHHKQGKRTVKPQPVVTKKPATKTQKMEGSQPSLAENASAVTKKSTRSKSRCAAVASGEIIGASRTTTGGLFITMDMCPRKKKQGNEILNLVEMLDGESNFVKEEAIKDLTQEGMSINIYAHDCACVVKKRFEGIYCKKCMLDGYHGSRHKCKLKTVKYRASMNSQAAEQAWSRLDKFSSVTKMTRAHYRFFWYCYALWRNTYVKSKVFRSDVTPLTSRKRLRRHGKA